MSTPTDRPQVGSLFSGTGGLDMAVTAVLGGSVAWHCDNDPAAMRLLAHHHPDAPNLGDITVVDWSGVEPVDVLTGGFPCTDVSSAGRRAGMRPDTRSGLWTHMAHAIDALRPGLVVLENVRGLLSASAACDVEPCPWCVGDGAGEPVLRALGAVLGNLADVGYDTGWCGLRAADVGAPHGRFRVFIVARPATDTLGGELQRRGDGGVLAGTEGARAGEGPQRERGRHAAGDGGEDAPHADGVGQVRGGGAWGGWPGPADHGERVTADAASPRLEWSGPEPSRSGLERGGGATPDAEGERWGEGWPEPAREDRRPDVAERSDDDAEAAWGGYGPAIRRWELILGRPAPAPVQLSAAYLQMVARRKAGEDKRPVGFRGSLRPSRQLAPRFVEWMVGLPEGHVTAVPGLSRNEQLKLLGGIVVPQQGAIAVAHLLDQAHTTEAL